MFSHEIRRISKDQLPGMVSPISQVIHLIHFVLDICTDINHLPQVIHLIHFVLEICADFKLYLKINATLC